MKLIFTYILLFLILYLDPLTIAFGLKWAQIWKILFIAFSFSKFLKSKVKLSFLKYYLLLSIMMIFSRYSLDYFFETLALLIKGLFLPAVYIFFYNTDLKNLLNKTLFFSIFIITSFIPFYFNLIPELGENYDLGLLGFEQNDSIVGLFQKPHTASTVLAYASISLAYFILNIKLSKRLKNVLILLFVLSIYFQVKTYVRLGLLMCIVGSLYLFLKSSSIRQQLNLVVFSLILLVISIQLFMDSAFAETYTMRLLGDNSYSSNYNSSTGIDYDKVSSKRFTIWFSSFNNWLLDDSFMDMLFGITEEELKVRNLKTTGMQIFSHNLFIDMLVVNGILGFMMLIYFLRSWLKFIKSSFSSFKKYAFSIYIIFLITAILQGGVIIYEGVFIVLSILIINKFQFNGISSSYFNKN